MEGAPHTTEIILILNLNKANLRDLIAATGLAFLLKIGFKSLIFGPMWPANLMKDIKKTIGQLLYTMSISVHHFKAIGEFKLELQSGNAQFGSKFVIFLSPVTSKFDRWPWKNNRAHLLSYFKLCAWFHSHLSFKMELQSGNAKFGSKSAIFWSRVTLKFDGWPWETIGHLFYAPSSFVYHSIAFCEIKMKLQSGNTNFGSKSAIFCPVWPWNLTDDLEKQ